MNQHEINQAEWANQANWHWGVYNSPRDTRVWVSKPIPWTGWTLNFAHRMAWVWLLAILLPGILVVIACIIGAAPR